MRPRNEKDGSESMKFISFIVPCYNEEQTINSFYKQILEVMQQIDVLYEIIFIDDGSKDSTAEIIRRLCKEDPSISFISLSRNFGKESAMFAGLEHAKGDAVIIIDADLQHPPGLIPQLVEGWQIEKYDVVYARRINREGEPILRSWFSKKFYSIINKISDVKLVDGVVDYRIMDRKVVDSILGLRERHRFSKGLFEWAGFHSKCIEYKNVERAAGNSSWNFSKLFHYAIEGIVSFTIVPLRIATFVGILTALAAFIYMGITIIQTLLFGNSVSGYTSTISLILFFGGIHCIFLGIIGEYLGRIFNEVKHRPHYFIREHIESRVRTFEFKK